MEFLHWVDKNYIEVFGAVTGILYVFLEVRQNLWLWPLGIITSATYIWVFFVNKFYAEMSLQVYYLVISIFGWYWWEKSARAKRGRSGRENSEQKVLVVSHLRLKTGLNIIVVFLLLFTVLWFVLKNYTDSPVPLYDSFITSLSIIATWMLARKIFEHWYLWVFVNAFSAAVFLSRGLIPTTVLFIVYGVMSVYGISEWKKTIKNNKL